MIEPEPPPVDLPPHDYAVIRSTGTLIRWKGHYWTWRDGRWTRSVNSYTDAAVSTEGDRQRRRMADLEAEVERLRKIEQAAKEIDKAIGQWAGVALSPEVAKAYGALTDALDGIDP